jgi:hypothetical protein
MPTVLDRENEAFAQQDQWLGSDGIIPEAWPRDDAGW